MSERSRSARTTWVFSWRWVVSNLCLLEFKIRFLCCWFFTNGTTQSASGCHFPNLYVSVVLFSFLSSSFQESLSEGAQTEMLTRSEKMRHFGIYLGSWFLSTSLAFGCGSGIHFLCQYEQEVPTFIHDYSLKQGCPDHSPVRFCVLWAKKKKSFHQRTRKVRSLWNAAHGDWFWIPLLNVWWLIIDHIFSTLCQLSLVINLKQILHQKGHSSLLLIEHHRWF